MSAVVPAPLHAWCPVTADPTARIAERLAAVEHERDCAVTRPTDMAIGAAHDLLVGSEISGGWYGRIPEALTAALEHQGCDCDRPQRQAAMVWRMIEAAAESAHRDYEDYEIDTAVIRALDAALATGEEQAREGGEA